jgi:AcrR family transcriptional regulator
VAIEQPVSRRVTVATWDNEGAPGPEEQALLDTLPPSRRLRSLVRDLDRLIGQEGFLHLNTDDLAARLRCSKASLYRLAPGLDELFELAIKLQFARAFDAVRLSREAARDCTEQLIAQLDSLVREQSKMSFAYMRDLFAFPRTASLINTYRTRGAAELKVILQAGIEAGEFEPVNPTLAAQLLSMTINRICEPDFQSSTGLPSAEALEEALRILTVGIIRRPPSRSAPRSRRAGV